MTKARDLANGGFGLVLMKPSTVVNGTDNGKGTVSFTGQTTVSLNGVFNSTYNNYRIVYNVNQVSAFAVNLRLRASGTDASGTNYKNQNVRLDSVGTSNGVVASGNLITLGDDSIKKSVGTLDVFNPFLAESTQFTFMSGTNAVARYGLVEHQVSTSYDGFSLTSSGTMTGTVSVYGYNK